jgi:hypothetical protein
LQPPVYIPLDASADQGAGEAVADIDQQNLGRLGEPTHLNPQAGLLLSIQRSFMHGGL